MEIKRVIYWTNFHYHRVTFVPYEKCQWITHLCFHNQNNFCIVRKFTSMCDISRFNALLNYERKVWIYTLFSMLHTLWYPEHGIRYMYYPYRDLEYKICIKVDTVDTEIYRSKRIRLTNLIRMDCSLCGWVQRVPNFTPYYTSKIRWSESVMNRLTCSPTTLPQFRRPYRSFLQHHFERLPWINCSKWVAFHDLISLSTLGGRFQVRLFVILIDYAFLILNLPKV